MSNWKLTLSYDGTPFNGWQVQPGLPTIQGTLQQAIAAITGTPLADTALPQGSGRTDAGVHALGQVVSVALAAPIPPENLLRALNHALPPAIRVLSAEPAPDTFHARHSVLRKTYEYRIFERHPATNPSPTAPSTSNRIAPGCGTNTPPSPVSSFSLVSYLNKDPANAAPSPDQPSRTNRIAADWDEVARPATESERICPPFLAPFVWDCRWPLALEPMQRAATLLCGTHDFTSFAASDPDLSERTSAASGPNPIKTLHSSKLTREHDLLLYRVTGTGFLHHMVRNIVGTLTEIGRGALPPEDIPRILAARDRSAAGPTAPAHGLYLVHVDYRPIMPGNRPLGDGC